MIRYEETFHVVGSDSYEFTLCIHLLNDTYVGEITFETDTVFFKDGISLNEVAFATFTEKEEMFNQYSYD